MNTSHREQDILKIISKLDITPTMYENAKEKYTSIAKFLENNGIEADMYPQGSFALGTVVRPNAKDPHAAYDLDFICQLRITRDDIPASELRKKVEEILIDSDQYSDKLTVDDTCLSIKYADVSGIGFSIDIVPAADENAINKKRLRLKAKNPELLETAIAIPDHHNNKYDWLTNNPKGYREWFNYINTPFQAANQKQYRQMLFEDNRAIYASVEQIPKELERSAMQRVIQIMKYHRDIYYSKILKGNKLKPISAIINTLVASISSTAPANLSVFDLLGYVLNEFSIYDGRRTLTEAQFNLNYQNKTVIDRKNGEWIIENPANPEDNLASQWNENPDIPNSFFNWVKVVREDLIVSLQLDDEDFRAKIEDAFGQKAVTNAWAEKYNKIRPQPILPHTPAKPWRVQ